MSGRKDRGPAFVYDDPKSGIRIPVYHDPAREGKYLVHCNLGHGKTIRRRAATPEAARQIAAELIEQFHHTLNPRGSKQTLQVFVNEWWSRVIAPSQLSPKTKLDYRTTIERYLLPDWGKFRLEELTAPVVITMFYTLERKYSTATAHRALTKLSMILEAARTIWRYLSYNAVVDARKQLPAHVVDEKIPLTFEETQRLYAAVAGHRLEALYHIAIILGLRLGELLGLQWTDVDWQARTITVRRQVQDVGSVKEERDTTKGKRVRVLPLTPHVYAKLAQLYQSGPAALYIFPNEDGGAFSPAGFTRHFRGGVTRRYTKKDGTHGQSVITGMRQKAALPDYVTPHTFRHTCSTRLLDLGVDEVVRAKILGHGKKNVTQRYAHADLALMRAALEQLEHLMYDRAA